MQDIAYILGSSPEYIESLYQEYVLDPSRVDQEFRKFFEGFDFAVANYKGGTKVEQGNIQNGEFDILREINVYKLIYAYRDKGHLIAKTNPIRPRKDRHANLDLSYFNLSDVNWDQEFYAGHCVGLGKTTLKNIVSKLTNCYAHKIGFEYTHINDANKIKWLEEEIESKFQVPLSLEKKRRILTKLNEAVIFEKFLHTKYVGQKRFSLEGGETTIVALDEILNVAAEYSVAEVEIGMAHRGRLNILANTLKKTYSQIFSEFEGTAKIDQTLGSGDVKYHLGFDSQVETMSQQKIHVKLMPNPSHLEAVNPIVTGFSRAKADLLYKGNYNKVLPILIHGDAAVAGQGIIYELLQMSLLKGYWVGGTIHFVINNQIGFTTDFDDARSSDYCTSLATMVQAPILHVNGDDPEAVLKSANLAVRYRQQFQSDIFIDMVCYRRHGHNEGDDPKYTQPSLYQIIDSHPNPREVYTEFLMAEGEDNARALAQEMEKKFWLELQNRLDEVKQSPLPYNHQPPEIAWSKLQKPTIKELFEIYHTGLPLEDIKKMFYQLMSYPADFTPLKKIDKLLEEKKMLFEKEGKIDWASAELLAYATIVERGFVFRLSGEDVKRGTFSHRHLMIMDENNREYNRLSPFTKTNNIHVYNSLLSEYAVLGFEYGYALANPNSLTLWEAQFGDFANGAQIIIDQFIVAGEEKWGRMNGLVLLLPHGYEGQGPEHSSARMERYLQMCAENNVIIANITNASNLFHVLVRQITWPFRKPLIIFTPKGNLRLPESCSPIAEFEQLSFREVIDDVSVSDVKKITKVLFCTGKIYFDLMSAKIKQQKDHVAIVRIEQLYPLPETQLLKLFDKYQSALWYWVQEEPLNMGAATFMQTRFTARSFGVISRPLSASTASGYAKIHQAEQLAIITASLS
ncbi:MAG: 2-oxoglutarate dehydrogenase E1 component [Phycisphaerales bacterium]|nr:2-oxoglutarate dehydrogenase E1 component [Phycisphaerales bacterium]